MALLERHSERRKQDEDLERHRAGKICVAIYNAQGVKRRKGDPRPWTVDDFFPQPKPPQTEDDMLMAMELWARVAHVN